jgi:hypothetical protein
MPYNEKELNAVREKIAELVRTKPESDVRAYTDEVFPRLPQAMQDEIRMSMFITSLQDEAQELNVISKIQEEGLAASAELEAMSTEAQKETGA